MIIDEKILRECVSDTITRILDEKLYNELYDQLYEATKPNNELLSYIKNNEEKINPGKSVTFNVNEKSYNISRLKKGNKNFFIVNNNDEPKTYNIAYKDNKNNFVFLFNNPLDSPIQYKLGYFQMYDSNNGYFILNKDFLFCNISGEQETHFSNMTSINDNKYFIGNRYNRNIYDIYYIENDKIELYDSFETLNELMSYVKNHFSALDPKFWFRNNDYEDNNGFINYNNTPFKVEERKSSNKQEQNTDNQQDNSQQNTDNQQDNSQQNTDNQQDNSQQSDSNQSDNQQTDDNQQDNSQEFNNQQSSDNNQNDYSNSQNDYDNNQNSYDNGQNGYDNNQNDYGNGQNTGNNGGTFQQDNNSQNNNSGFLLPKDLNLNVNKENAILYKQIRNNYSNVENISSNIFNDNINLFEDLFNEKNKETIKINLANYFNLDSDIVRLRIYKQSALVYYFEVSGKKYDTIRVTLDDSGNETTISMEDIKIDEETKFFYFENDNKKYRIDKKIIKEFCSFMNYKSFSVQGPINRMRDESSQLRYEEDEVNQIKNEDFNKFENFIIQSLKGLFNFS